MKRTPAKRPWLEVRDLRIWRGDDSILDGVSWRVERGEHWAIVGANGSGKTSLLSALAGYLTPSAGEMTLLGRRYGESDWPALRRQVGLVSSSVRQRMADSEPALLSVVSGRYGVIDFWGKARMADVRRARKILSWVECGHLADRPWGVLSQGERQRVLIGRALMARPRLLILDEPCAGLDPVAREHFLGFLDRLPGRPRSPGLILVTHHVEEIVPVFTHVLVLAGGRVHAAGPKERVLTGGTLSGAFQAPVRVRLRGGRYELTVAKDPGGVL